MQFHGPSSSEAGGLQGAKGAAGAASDAGSWAGAGSTFNRAFKKGRNRIHLTRGPALRVPTAGPRSRAASFPRCGVWFSTAGEWARAGRGGRGAHYKGARRAKGATRSRRGLRFQAHRAVAAWCGAGLGTR